jgi:hypothetical protein
LAASHSVDFCFQLKVFDEVVVRPILRLLKATDKTLSVSPPPGVVYEKRFWDCLMFGFRVQGSGFRPPGAV